MPPILRPLVLLLVVCVGGCAVVGGEGPSIRYPVVSDEAAAVDRTLAEAAATDRLALIVIGANWCEDSAAFADALYADEASAVRARFEILLMDTGELEHGLGTAERFGLPVMAHTPTVMVIDPQTGDLVNWDDLHILRDAHRMTEEEIIAYVTAHRNADAGAPRPEPTARLAAWSDRQAQRISDSYDHLRKLGFGTPVFVEDWKPLAGLRYAFSEDYPRLLVASGRGELPALPAYDRLPWE